MASCIRCNLCAEPGTLDGAPDVGQVPCNVRRFQDDVFTVWRCTGCGSLHCAEDADLARYYADYPLKLHKLGFREHIAYSNRLRLLKRHGFRESDHLLDYGCGAGLFVDFLRHKGWKCVFGYDAFVSAYQERQIGDSYDAVVSYDVIEHDDDPRGFMRQVAGLVRGGGLLVIGTPNADHVSIADKYSPSLHVPYHRHVLSERMLLALGRERGFEPVNICRRSFADSLFPTVNSRYMLQYLEKTGAVDGVVEQPRIDLVLRSPGLLFLAFFGYFFPAGDYIMVIFRKK